MANTHPSEPLYEIRGWDTADDHFIISLRASGYRCTISVASQDFIESPLAYGRFQQVLDKLTAGEDHDYEVWDYSEEVVDTFLPQFTEFPPLPVYSGKITLAELQPRGAFDGKYCVVEETPRAGNLVRRVVGSTG